MYVKIYVCSFALLQLKKAVMFMSVRSFLALHLCWQLTALLQLWQSSKPAAALAGMPFLIPPLHLLSPPFHTPIVISNFLRLGQKHIATKPDQAPRRDHILRHNYKHVVRSLTLSSFEFIKLTLDSEDRLLHWSHLLPAYQKTAIIYAGRTAI